MVTSKSLGKQNLAISSPSKNGNSWVLGLTFLITNSILRERINGKLSRSTTRSPRDSESILSTTLVASPVLDWLVVVVVSWLVTSTWISRAPTVIHLVKDWLGRPNPRLLAISSVLGAFPDLSVLVVWVIVVATSTPIQSVCHAFQTVETSPVFSSAPISAIVSS